MTSEVMAERRPKAKNYVLVSRAIKQTAVIAMLDADKAFAGSIPKLRPPYGAVDFRAVRRRSCTTSSVLIAQRRSGNRRGHRGCHPRIGAETVPWRTLGIVTDLNQPMLDYAASRQTPRQSHQMAPS